MLKSFEFGRTKGSQSERGIGALLRQCRQPIQQLEEQAVHLMHHSLAVELIPAPRPVEGLPTQIAQFCGMPGLLEGLRRRCFEQRPEGLGEMEDPIRHLAEIYTAIGARRPPPGSALSSLTPVALSIKRWSSKLRRAEKPTNVAGAQPQPG